MTYRVVNGLRWLVTSPTEWHVDDPRVPNLPVMVRRLETGRWVVTCPPGWDRVSLIDVPVIDRDAGLSQVANAIRMEVAL